MSVFGATNIANVGSGTLATNAASSSIVPGNFQTGTLQGSLVLLVAYVVGADCTLATGNGGWKILNAIYDTANGFGGILAAKITDRSGNHSGYTGSIDLPGTAAWTAQNAVVAFGSSVTNGQAVNAKWAIERCPKLSDGFSDTASGTGHTHKTICPVGTQGIYVIGGGYNNAGTTTTIGASTGYLEAFDAGQVSPTHGVWLDYTQSNVVNWNGMSNTPSSNALAVAKTNRVSLGAHIPLEGNLCAGAGYKRMARGRRYG